MVNAIKEAQDKFNIFESELIQDSRRVVPAIEECLIKYAFLTPNSTETAVEHMFISDPDFDGTLIKGTLASEPEHADVESGDEIVINKAYVSDWLYIIDGKTVGGFTFKYMWGKSSKEEKKMYKKSPPFCWLELK